MPPVAVPVPRLERWVANFEASHGAATYEVRDGRLTGRAEDGSHFSARLPFGAVYRGGADPVVFREAAAATPVRWGVLLVRKGGFAVARLAGHEVEESKVGQRHVQGRTKAGGQSQQRFARRRGNQARQAYEAAADHAARILTGPLVVVTGGDHAAVDAVLSDPRLAGVTVVEPWLPVPEPRRATLDSAIADALSVRIDVTNA
jgi:hypothetical protein